eukprot:9111008-Pyramimonas_sp.AAC.1
MELEALTQRLRMAESQLRDTRDGMSRAHVEKEQTVVELEKLRKQLHDKEKTAAETHQHNDVSCNTACPNRTPDLPLGGLESPSHLQARAKAADAEMSSLKMILQRAETIAEERTHQCRDRSLKHEAAEHRAKELELANVQLQADLQARDFRTLRGRGRGLVTSKDPPAPTDRPTDRPMDC